MTESAETQFVEGNLTAAVSLATHAVKNQPRDAKQRTFLVELLCFAAEFDRARAQLDTLSRIVPESRLGAEHLLRLITGEQIRRQVLAGVRPVSWLAAPSVAAEARASGVQALGAGRSADAAEILSRAELARTPIAGTHGTVAFGDFRDLDDRLASAVELITDAGGYGWLPLEDIAQIQFRPTQLARDLIWRSARIRTVTGATHQSFVPALYPVSDRDTDSLKLGRETDWRQPVEGVFLGAGRKLILVGETDLDILQLQKLEFGASS
jgi:type VI secretion system protein ImpE